MATTLFERALGRGLFFSRWLLAPFYLGLVAALGVLLVNFLQELWHFILSIPTLTQTDAVLGVLSLIDLSLAGNLLLIVIFSGYENFVSKMDIRDYDEQPQWLGTVDFATLKLKLISSIVAISGIHLLKVFMDIDKVSDREIMWKTLLHVVFVITGVLLAVMDRVAAATKVLKKK